MAFQLKLPQLPNRGKATANEIKMLNIHQFQCEKLPVHRRIATGAFGDVYTTEYKFPGNTIPECVIIKKMLRVLDPEEEKLFFKEVTFLNDLKHDNIVKFKAVSCKPLAIMLEYLYFDLSLFGDDMRVSSLSDLLLQLNKYNCQGFHDLVRYAGKEIIHGLSYLHSRGIAHRDLKPGNVLVSNQHYLNLSDAEIPQAYRSRPITCKLTDFGESRSEFIHTQTLLASKTEYIDRGTVVYMAPELLGNEVLANASISDLLLVDIWALGMVFFSMVNPSLKYPFSSEIRSAGCKTPEDLKELVISLLQQKKLPLPDQKYEVEQATVWCGLDEIYRGCVNFERQSRLTLEEATEIIDRDILENINVLHLKVSQDTAVQQFDQQLANHMHNNEDTEQMEHVITNDGTNSCAFLSVKIADTLLAAYPTGDDFSRGLCKVTEDIIWNLPAQINRHRDISMMYEPMQAYTILNQQNLLYSSHEFTEELPFSDPVFSVEGRERLHTKLCQLGRNDFVAIYVSDPFVLTVGCHEKIPFIIDTHPVSLSPGNGEGMILTGKDNSSDAWKSLCVWLWMRLSHGGVNKLTTSQSLALVKPQPSNEKQGLQRKQTNSGSEENEEKISNHVIHLEVDCVIMGEPSARNGSTVSDVSEVSSDKSEISTDQSDTFSLSDKNIHSDHSGSSTQYDSSDIPDVLNKSHDSQKRKKKAKKYSGSQKRKKQTKKNRRTKHTKEAEGGNEEKQEEEEIAGHSSNSQSDGQEITTVSSASDKGGHEEKQEEDEIAGHSSNSQSDGQEITTVSPASDQSIKPASENDCARDVSQQTVTSNPKEQEFWNDFPLYGRRQNRYTATEAIEILLAKHPQLCNTHPLKVRENATFVVNVSKYKNWEDVKCDMNGVYNKNVRCGTWTYQIEDGIIQRISTKKEACKSSNEYHLVQNIKKNKSNSSLTRGIYLLKDSKGDIVNGSCLIQYSISTSEESVHLTVAAHGNRKIRPKPFFPSKKSTITSIKEMVKEVSVAKTFQDLMNDGGGACASTPSDIPRGRQQVYDIKRRVVTQVDPVNDLLIYARDNKKKVVLNHSDYPTDVWVLGTEVMCNDLTRFTTSEFISRPFSVDATFNFGTYEVTAVSYPNLMLKTMRTKCNEHPTFLGPVMIHHAKNHSTYKILSSTIATNCTAVARQTKGFVTDGEKALFSAFKEDFPGAVHLRCFRHFRNNCCRKLYSIGITKENDQAFFIQQTFGNKTNKEKGILDAEDKKELKKLLRDAKEALEEKERELVGKSNPEYKPKYYQYLEDNYTMMKECMISTVRKKVGLGSEEDGSIQRCYTNSSEAVNNLMKLKKEKYLQENPGSVLTKIAFTKNVFEELHDEQMRELALALGSMSEKYELSDIAKHLEVKAEEWVDWNKEEKQSYIDQVNKLSMRDIIQKKVPQVEERRNSVNEFREPEISIANCLQEQFTYSMQNAKAIEESVIELLNHPEAIQKKATLEVNEKARYQVACRHVKAKLVEVTLLADHATCLCGRYKHDKICSHSLAVASTNSILEKHIAWTARKRGSKNATALAQYGVNVAVAGKKGSRTKYPYRSKQVNNKAAATTGNTESEGGIYTEIYHNDNNFVLTFITEKCKRCKSCELDFNHRQRIVGYDIAFSHKERWFYPVKGDWTKKRSTTKETDMYYHTQLSCLKQRFPYFDKQFIEIPNEIRVQLKTAHKQILTHEFGLDW